MLRASGVGLGGRLGALGVHVHGSVLALLGRPPIGALVAALGKELLGSFKQGELGVRFHIRRIKQYFELIKRSFDKDRSALEKPLSRVCL